MGGRRQPYTDESDVLLVVAVLIEHVAQQHAQQVARLSVRVLVAWRERRALGYVMTTTIDGMMCSRSSKAMCLRSTAKEICA